MNMHDAQQLFDDMPEPAGDEAGEIQEVIRLAQEALARAERALHKCDNEAARDHLRSAIIDLEAEAS